MQSALAGAAIRDLDILDLLRSGQRERAFEELLHRYEGKIYRLCLTLLRERAQAEDAAQESILRVWKALGSYDTRAALSSWIYAITRNRCLTALERRRTHSSVLDDDAEESLRTVAAPAAPAAPEGAALLRELVEALPERPRRVLLLYYFEERSIGEVAAMLGCPEGTVKAHLFRARATLARELVRRGLDDPDDWLGETP